MRRTTLETRAWLAPSPPCLQTGIWPGVTSPPSQRGRPCATGPTLASHLLCLPPPDRSLHLHTPVLYNRLPCPTHRAVAMPLMTADDMFASHADINLHMISAKWPHVQQARLLRPAQRYRHAMKAVSAGCSIQPCCDCWQPDTALCCRPGKQNI